MERQQGRAQDRLEVGDIPIDCLSFEGALSRISELVEAGRGGSVFTPNVDHVVLAAKNPDFREAYRASSLSLVDGMPVVWASRLLGRPLPEKISGSDLIGPLAEMSAERGYKLFLLGGAPGVAEAASSRLREQFPQLQIVGTESPEIDLQQPIPGDLVERIQGSGANCLLVALGAPKQELFIHRLSSSLGACVALGIGASLDFIAGHVKRAPPWMSRSGLEWFYRLVREPRRLWRRYLIQDPFFFAILFAQLLGLRGLFRREARAVSPLGGPTLLRSLPRMVKNQLRWRAQQLLDVALVFACVPASMFFADPGVRFGPETFWLAAFLAAVWVLESTVVRHYELSRRRSLVDDVAMVSLLAFLLDGVLLLASLSVGSVARIPSPGQFVGLFWPIALACRLLGNRSRYRHDGEAEIEEIVILGTTSLGRNVERALASRPASMVLGFIPLRGEEPQQLGGPILGSAGSLEQVLREFPVSEVYIAGNVFKQGEEIQEAIKICERFGVGFAMPVCGFRLDRAQPLTSGTSDGYIHYGCVRPKVVQMAVKRLIDIVVSAAGLLLISPFLLAVSAAIKLTSRGPVFFRQTRSGLHGRQFRMLKFRSMVVDAEELKAMYSTRNEQSGPVFKIRNDPRVTALGRFLRKYSIDELPQLLNVLRGDMSLVGPRPPVPTEVAQYQAWQRRRLSMRPGLTCIWEIRGRNELSFDQWMYLDMLYIDHWSLAEDLNILLQTVPVVLSGRGAS